MESQNQTITFKSGTDLSEFIRGIIDQYTEKSIKEGAVKSIIDVLEKNKQTVLNDPKITFNNEAAMDNAKKTIDFGIQQLELVNTTIDISKEEFMKQFAKIDFETIILNKKKESL